MRILVTGGTIRLGAVIAAHLRAAGHAVVTASHRADAGADIIGYDHLDMAGFDGLVNNAALYRGPAAQVRAVNYELPIRLAKAMTHGAVVNILDGTAKPAPWKRELADFTVKPLGTVRMNGVAPGPVLPPAGFHLKADPTPFGRPAPEAVAEAVRFLLEARFIAGCILPIDGGAHFVI